MRSRLQRFENGDRFFHGSSDPAPAAFQKVRSSWVRCTWHHSLQLATAAAPVSQCDRRVLDKISLQATETEESTWPGSKVCENQRRHSHTGPKRWQHSTKKVLRFPRRQCDWSEMQNGVFHIQHSLYLIKRTHTAIGVRSVWGHFIPQRDRPRPLAKEKTIPASTIRRTEQTKPGWCRLKRLRDRPRPLAKKKAIPASAIRSTEKADWSDCETGLGLWLKRKPFPHLQSEARRKPFPHRQSISEAQSERNQASATSTLIHVTRHAGRSTWLVQWLMHGTHAGSNNGPREAPHKGLPRLGPVEREGGNGRSTKALTWPFGRWTVDSSLPSSKARFGGHYPNTGEKNGVDLRPKPNQIESGLARSPIVDRCTWEMGKEGRNAGRGTSRASRASRVGLKETHPPREVTERKKQDDRGLFRGEIIENPRSHTQTHKISELIW